MHARESQDCYKGDSGEDSERKEENSRESFYLLRKCINYYEQNIGRHTVGKGYSGEVSDGIDKQSLDEEKRWKMLYNCIKCLTLTLAKLGWFSNAL